MTLVYVTIDTEYEAGYAARHGLETRQANFDRAIRGRTPTGDAGIFYQMDVFDRLGLKAVFFIDPMPALVWGTGAIADIVQPVLERGHDVQLHLHTEWLALAGDKSPVGNRTGDNLADFSFDEQCRLIDYARTALMDAGAPRPVAFRAGNYGANDDTLRALAELGFTHDSNHTPGIPDSPCRIALDTNDRSPVQLHGVIEVPIGCVGDALQGVRHGQLTALSRRELMSAIRHARTERAESFTIVSHSFELLCRRRKRINRVLRRRFEKFCEDLAALPGVATGTYRDNPPQPAAGGGALPVLGPSYLRTGERVAEQVVSHIIYEDRWKRAAAMVAASVAAQQQFDII